MSIFEKCAAQFGTVTINGKTYALINDPSRTNRVFAGWFGDAAEGEEYVDEWSAAGIDADENEVVIRWQFYQVRGEEVADDELAWDRPYEVICA